MIATLTLEAAGNIASIVAALASVAILTGGGGRWLRRRWLFRHPLDVYFVGSDHKPHKVWVAPRTGSQYLALTVLARLDVWVEEASFALYGSMNDKPQDRGMPCHLLPTADDLDEFPSRVASGKTDVEDAVRFPKLMPKGEYIPYHRHVFGIGPWEGEVELRFIVRTPDGLMSKYYVKRLPFSVATVEK